MKLHLVHNGRSVFRDNGGSNGNLLSNQCVKRVFSESVARQAVPVFNRLEITSLALDGELGKLKNPPLREEVVYSLFYPRFFSTAISNFSKTEYSRRRSHEGFPRYRDMRGVSLKTEFHIPQLESVEHGSHDEAD